MGDKHAAYDYQNGFIDEAEFYEQIDVTSNDELRELVAEWRDSAEIAEVGDLHNELYVSGIRGCANQLEALIEGETDD